jgi:uncharacterized surface protein with fasciclin (FAS1) repeats
MNMKNTLKRYIKPVAICSALLVMMIASCKNDDYYIDGGKADPKFKGNILQYLQSNPAKFDTIVQIIKLAGLEDMFANDDITVFCPTDENIRRTIGLVNRTTNDELKNKLNQELFNNAKDTIKVLSDVPATTWRKFMLRYVVKGKYVLKDYPQLDFSLRELYPGGYFFTTTGDLVNIGVVYNSVNSVKYTGYRQLSIAYLPDASNKKFYYSAAVATSDVQPTNGVVHVLAIGGGTNIGELFTDSGADNFGFGFEFNTDVILNR